MARGALAVDPRVSPGVYRNQRGQLYHNPGPPRGALSRDPKPNKKRQPKQIDGAPAQVPPVNPTYSVQDSELSGAMNNIFQRFGDQGNFDPNLPEMPGDYGAMRQKAEQMAMDSFNRNMEPQFQREEQQFRDQMAQMGVPETSEQYKVQYEQLKNQQNAARQNAMTSAFQAGQGEQAQAFGQALQGRQNAFGEQFQGYQLPMAQMNAMSPYYAQQMQNQQFNQNMDWQTGQNALNRQHDFNLGAQQNKFARGQMRLSANLNPGGGGGGGGGGGMSMQDRQALMNQEFYNNMVMQAMNNGQQMPMPGYAGGFIQGMGGGVGAGVAAGLGAGLR